MNTYIFDALQSGFGYVGSGVIQFGMYAVYSVSTYYLIKIMYQVSVGKREESGLDDHKTCNLLIETAPADTSKSKPDTNKIIQVPSKPNLEKIQINKLYAEAVKLEAASKRKELELAQFKTK